MMLPIARAALALAALTLLPIAAGAQAPGSPVTLTACDVLPWHSTSVSPGQSPFAFHTITHGAPTTNGLHIAFVNRSPQIADQVAVQVDYRGEAERIVDAGTFSPNVAVDHTFGNFSGMAYLGPRPNRCRVVAVRFKNGATWQNPERQQQ